MEFRLINICAAFIHLRLDQYEWQYGYRRGVICRNFWWCRTLTVELIWFPDGQATTTWVIRKIRIIWVWISMDGSKLPDNRIELKFLAAQDIDVTWSSRPPDKKSGRQGNIAALSWTCRRNPVCGFMRQPFCNIHLWWKFAVKIIIRAQIAVSVMDKHSEEEMISPNDQAIEVALRVQSSMKQVQ